MYSQRQPARPRRPSNVLCTAACRNPEVAAPKNPVICQIAILFASSALLYHEPRRKMIIGEKPDSKKPTMKRKAYIWFELVAAA
jgi:hypothetical protein